MSETPDEYRDHSNATIIWDGPTPPGEIIAKVRENIASELGVLDTPQDLMFHVVPLNKQDFEGATVVLFGGEHEGTFVGVWSAVETEHDIIDIPGGSKAKIPGHGKLYSVQLPSVIRKRGG